MLKKSGKNNLKIDGNEFAIIKKELEDNKELWDSEEYFELALNRFNNALMNWVKKEYRVSLDLLEDLKYVCPSSFDLTKIDLIVAILTRKAEALQVR